MTIWLVYDEENIARNTFFIDRWREACIARGVSLRLVKTCDIAYGVFLGKPAVTAAGEKRLPEAAVMRAQRPLLSKQLENCGVHVFNNAFVSLMCNDKQRTHLQLGGLVPMMDTAFVGAPFARCPFPFPVVVKPAHGCGGRQVTLAKTQEEYDKALAAILPDTAVAQMLCTEPGRDLRVYMLGNTVLQAMLRVSETDFRSNFGLGGSAKPVDVPGEVVRMLDIIKAQFTFGLVGVDFIRHKKHWVFNEIEDAVGTRMLYAHTRIDPVRLYLDHILKSI